MLRFSPNQMVIQGMPGLLAVAIYLIVAVGLSVLLAFLSWRFIEAPMLSLKRFAAYDSPRSSPVAVSVQTA